LREERRLLTEEGEGEIEGGEEEEDKF